MPQIINLSPIGDVQPGDAIPVFDESNGDARRMSVGQLSTYMEATLSLPDNAADIDYDPAGTGAVQRTVEGKLRDVVDVRDYGIVVDGATSQTSELVTLMGALSSSSYRGTINIPYGTKFDVSTVYAAVPLGVILQDESSINWGQPPSYKNKFLITYSGDAVADDTQEIIASPHHPALMLLNMGTDVSVAAASRYATILQGVGNSPWKVNGFVCNEYQNPKPPG